MIGSGVTLHLRGTFVNLQVGEVVKENLSLRTPSGRDASYLLVVKSVHDSPNLLKTYIKVKEGNLGEASGCLVL